MVEVDMEVTMARKPRFSIAGLPQHVIQRGNNREPCFFTNRDYRYYLDALRIASVQFDCAIHAYVLMTNHVHLLVTPVHGDGIPAMMQSLGRRYVRHINDIYQRSGTLWEGRYKACLVETGEYFLTCYRYIELNPVRATMAKTPGDYPWTSYRYNAQEMSDALVTEHAEYQNLGSGRPERCSAYRELFRYHLASDEIHTIRKSVNEELILGSEHFKDQIEQACHRRVRPGKAGRPGK
jgi:putative transposase